MTEPRWMGSEPDYGTAISQVLELVREKMHLFRAELLSLTEPVVDQVGNRL